MSKQITRQGRIQDALNSLKQTDTFSLMLFTLYKLRDLPEYTTLSELCYILDGDNLSKFLSYYGGMTITIPTLRDMRLMVQALLLFQSVNLEGKDFAESLAAACKDEFSESELKDTYKCLLEVTSNYEFKRD